jgi:methionyl-tRNA synthetase
MHTNTVKAEPDRIRAVVGLAANLILLLAAVMRPFIPGVSDAIAEQLKVTALNPDGTIAEDLLIPDKWQADTLKPGHEIGPAQRLFTPIEAIMEEKWKDQFGGEEARKAKEEKRLKAEKKKADKAKKKGKKTAGASDAPVASPAAKVDDKVDEIAKQVETLRTGDKV